MDLSLIEKDLAAFAALMMAKPHGSAFTPPIHDDGADIDGAWCRAHDAAVDAPSISAPFSWIGGVNAEPCGLAIMNAAKAAGSFSMRLKSIMAALLALKFLPELWKLYSFHVRYPDLAADAPIEPN